MTLIQSPETIMLIHRTMVQEEIDRRRHTRHITEPRTRSGVIMTIRSLIGRALIDAGTRIAPAERRGTAAPITGRLSVAR
jgi:hypothetical protein